MKFMSFLLTATVMLPFFSPTNVVAQSTAVSWVGRITMLFQPSEYTRISNDEMLEKARLLAGSLQNRMPFTNEFNLSKWNEMTYLNTHVVVILEHNH